MARPHGAHTGPSAGDDDVLDSVRKGDVDAYAVLYERHADAARRLARQLVRGDSEADDVVAEAFTRVLAAVQRGGGPKKGFRPYLLTALRRAVYDRSRGEERQIAAGDMEGIDPGAPFIDPVLEGLERSLIARAFRSLPERWQTVLWHTEIEGAKPAEAAPILGMSPNSVAALAYRAREGLRRAYLQMHLAGGVSAESCRPVLDLLGAYVRSGLAKRDTAIVEGHLDGCADCREVHAELVDVDVALRGTILPIFAGPAAAGYLAALPSGGVSGALSGVLSGGWWGQMSWQQQAITVGTAAAAAAAIATTVTLGGERPLPPTSVRPPTEVSQEATPDAPERPGPSVPPEAPFDRTEDTPSEPSRSPAAPQPDPTDPAPPPDDETEEAVEPEPEEEEPDDSGDGLHPGHRGHQGDPGHQGNPDNNGRPGWEDTGNGEPGWRYRWDGLSGAGSGGAVAVVPAGP